MPLSSSDMEVLKDMCGDDTLHYELTRELLDVVRQQRGFARRAGLFKSLEDTLRRGSHDSAESAEALALSRRDALEGQRAQ